jgi:DNA repair exonuclease SbcCD ATPase subunit
LNGITGIFGPNRVGKSSITGAILYALFNASDRGSIKNQAICNIRKQFCDAFVELTVNNRLYRFERQTVKKETKKGDINALTALNVFEIIGSEKKDLVGDTRIDSDKIIRKLIGSADDLLLTGISTQGELEQFVKNKSTLRWQTLARFLDIDFFNDLHKLANEDLKGLKARLKNYPDKNWSDVAKQLQTQYTECDKIIVAQTKKHQEDSDKLQTLLIEFDSKKDQELVTLEQVEDQQKLIDQLQQQKNSIYKTLLSNKEKIKLAEIDKETSQAKLVLFDIQKLQAKKEELELKQKKFDANTSKNTICENKIQTAKKRIALLDVVPCHDTFPTCDFIKDAHNSKQILLDLNKEYSELLHEHSLLQTEIAKLQAENISVLIREYDSLKTKIASAETIILQLTNANLKLNLSLTEYSAKLDAALNEIDRLNQLYQDAENKRLVALSDDIEELRNSIKICDKTKLHAATLKGKIENEILTLREEKNKRNELLSQTIDYEIITNAFSRKGLPKQIISLNLPIINNEINKILSGIVSYTIEFEEDADTDKLDIYLNYGDSKRIIELGSGMEKMIASIAIRVALFNISTLPKPDFLIIDEGFGALDESNTEACVRLLKSLTQYFKSIIIISHIDAIKDAADNMLEITKNGQDSNIVYN